jgi:Asp-tRNA(Asn)/Glu-tRNA(Gln) amidotransferase A subunit family amidase
VTVPPLSDLSARDIARGVIRGDFTAEAVARDCLDRIAARESEIQAWQFLDPERALAEARAVDRAPGRGKLAGVPVGIKDVIDTADMPTTYGSALYRDFRPRADASCVALMRGAGAVGIGKTVTTEFAAVSPGKTRNPHNTAHTPGGSSSGSAAAVGAGTIPLAFGTQTSGSTIRPASFCGAVGYKPTFGMIDRTGVKTLASSLDTVGLFARNVRDIAFFAAVLSGRDDLVVGHTAAKPRIGLFRTAQWSRAEAASVAAIDRAIPALGKAGVTVRELSVPKAFESILDHHDKVMGRDMTMALAHERLRCGNIITAKTRDFLAAATSVDAAAYDKARAGVIALYADFSSLFADCDVLLTPAATGEAPEGVDSTGDPTFNRGWTLLHVPCVTVPAGTGPKRLPVGVQIVGPRHHDAQTLAAATFVEHALAQG